MSADIPINAEELFLFSGCRGVHFCPVAATGGEDKNIGDIIPAVLAIKSMHLSTTNYLLLHLVYF